ncbi:hypothetical protein ACSTS3_12570 [Aquimarina muelleri]|uniref:hypothetical protein n=1 Tax=Aquimarina muelleri TaxID=279356 RepID=UPI003F685BAB
MTNTISGNRIATVNFTGGTVVDVNETITNLNQNTTTGVITYTNENTPADTQTANVVSTNANNQISVGTDGGAFLNIPVVYAAGKVNANGTVNTGAIYNATVTKVTTNNGTGGGTEGDYQITFTTPLPNANYVIQLTIADCGGDCPGNSTANYDDPGITYYTQTTGGFFVNIKDSDNGTVQGDDIDLDFMFTVIRLPN